MSASTALSADTLTPECLAIESAFAKNQIEALASMTVEQPRWRALQHFRLAAAYIPTNARKQARAAVGDGLTVVNSALKANPDDVPMLLLGAMLDGQYLLLDRWRFLHNGLRGLARLRRAEALEPGNPRVALIRGTAKVVMPSLIGGDPSEAIALFEQALARPVTTGDGSQKPFADSPLCAAGQWSQVDLLNWLGRAYSKIGNSDAAEQAYQSALARSPDNHWVQLAAAGAGYEWAQAP